ncbi:MAG: DUF3313 domain-containing protein [Planctomycetes bacterium]|nr:DUF3313 domain-containing protein [Planctomycetota bacterium]
MSGLGTRAVSVAWVAVGLGLAVVSTVLPGCASGASGEASKAYTKVLAHPEKLKPSAKLEGGFSWLAPDAGWKAYDKVAVDRILVRLDGRASQKSIDPVTLAGLVDYFHKAVVKELSPKYQIVEQPGPGVLVARFTIYDLAPTNVAENLAFQAVPFGGGVVGGALIGETSGKGFGSAPYLGETGIALQMMDGATGRLVGEFADTQFGKQYVIDLNQGVGTGFTKGTGAYIDSFSTWAYARTAFDEWAKFFRTRLDELREGR